MAESKQGFAIIAGAGGSVGNAIAAGLLEQGFSAALFYRSDRHTEALKQRFKEFRDRVILHQVDLSDADRTHHAVARLQEKAGEIHLLVNAAGGWIGGKNLHEHSAEDMQKMLNMDLIPVFNLMSSVLPVMKNQGFGKIIHFASATALGSGAMNAVYAASKSGVLALCRAAAEEYRPFGVEIYALAPTTIDTEKNRRAMPNANFDQWVKLEEIVQLVQFLATRATALSGTVFRLEKA